MLEQYKKEIQNIRGMEDAAALAYMIDKYPPNSELATLHALNIIGKRPWKKAVGRQLVNSYIESVHKSTFGLAIDVFLLFTNENNLSLSLWAATDNDPADRYFAGYYFTSAIQRKFGREHEALKIWKDVKAP